MQKHHVSGSAGSVPLAVGLVAAYVSNNALRPTDLPELIARVHAALTNLGGSARTAATAEPVAERPSAAQIRKSVQPEGIVSFIDGRTYKMLKRHLTGHGLDPKSYRERYGLPADYPMVAPNYAAKRSAVAKAIGLGRPGAMAEREQKMSASRRKAA
ncbi:MucR family transcriptional regulator [Methylobacterium sp.]|uniref:MucR family transcriptional regulator n=1 Tax=Methylobacterium sp. TaxID=409 RepID=UPI000C4382E1|nr:MucR family transcriptional regulator [Methylobacterium sp.]MBP33019.1 MucR family transcriptional regulator [Methylobacterium sp.]